MVYIALGSVWSASCVSLDYKALTDVEGACLTEAGTWIQALMTWSS